MEEEKKHMDELIVTYLTEGLDKSALAELKAWIAASTENKITLFSSGKSGSLP